MNPQIEKVLQEIKAGEKKVLWFDIDGVIADTSLDGDYEHAVPDESIINIINELFDAGHEIVIATSRGTKREIEMREAINLQLKEWGLQYHRLIIMRRDFMVDDSTLRPDEFLDLLELPEPPEVEDMDDIPKDPVLVMETKEIEGQIVDFEIHTANDTVKRDCPKSPDGIHAIFSPETAHTTISFHNMTGCCIYCGKVIA